MEDETQYSHEGGVLPTPDTVSDQIGTHGKYTPTEGAASQHNIGEWSDHQSVSAGSMVLPLDFRQHSQSTWQGTTEGRRPTDDYASMSTSTVSNYPPYMKEAFQQDQWPKREEETQSISSTHSAKSSRSLEPNPFAQNEWTKEVTCDLCSDHKAVKTCLTCNISICEVDIRQHYLIPAMQRHILVDITEDVDNKRCQHFHRTLDVYCKTDQMQICSHCSKTSHREHDLIFIKTPAGEQQPCWPLPGDDCVPPPGEMKIQPLNADCVAISWEPPEGPGGPTQYRVAWQYDKEITSLKVKNVCQVEISGLKLGRKYDFAVTAEVENDRSIWIRKSYFTVIPPPKDLKIDGLNSTSITLQWTKASQIYEGQQHFVISYGIPGAEPRIIHTEGCTRTLSDLQPNTEYSVSVSTVLPEGEQSEPVSSTIRTSSFLMEILTNVGLSDHYQDKLRLSGVLEIKSVTMSEEQLDTMQSLPGAFLKKLMLANVDALSVRCDLSDEKAYIVELDSSEHNESESNNANAINPLDLITALFLCSDGSLQQEMMRKMAMCQFAVPLLLPNCETKQTTLMIWAMREIVKKFKPFTSTGTLVEECIVVSEIPLVSFVTLGKDRLNKYQILNKMQSNAFVHRDMDCDHAPRKISDGIVEISWCLPCGNRNIDMFDKPVAVANLRGDILSFRKEFSFLCEVSAAVYIFSDDYMNTMSVLKGKNLKTQLFLVMDGQRDVFRNSIRRQVSFDCSTPVKMIIKKRQHDADFVKNFQFSVTNVLNDKPNIVTIEKMAEVARHHGILVDEDSDECRKAQRMAEEISSKITDTLKFKEEHLPLQGIRRELSQVGREKDKADSVEANSLTTKEESLREKLKMFKMTSIMEKFIDAMLDQSTEERSYFLQWMKMNLDNMSRQNLSDLRAQYKNICQSMPKRNDLIACLDQKMFDCSLGLEHFFRELGQLYQWCMSERFFLENSCENKHIEQLPQMYAKMLLEGLPIELVDGDMSDIPMKWITDVLTCLHYLVKTKSKIRVVTVLGVQGTGKSTLLNTMFGVQFAVCTGRCTRGAFMQLIKVDRKLREDMKCDFIMIIDTEGLKAPELAQQCDSREHDRELATLVVGLSDVTIINMTMEAFAEMKAILKMVMCTFLGMKHVQKKPKFLFVHQNVTDMSTDANIRERKELSEQLDEMTLEAAKMVNNDKINKFTDVMDYDSDTSCSYMPGLWHGIPPMAPVSVAYSEAVYDLKKKLIQELQQQQRGDLKDFLELIKNLRECVKYQNTFCLGNKLCAAFKNWELVFSRKIASWMEKSEMQVCDGDTIPEQQQFLREANTVLELAEKEMLHSLEKYLEQQDLPTSIIEKHREELTAKAKKLCGDTGSQVRIKLQQSFKKKVEVNVNSIKSPQAFMLEKHMLELLHHCKSSQTPVSGKTLIQEFEKRWRKAVMDCEINIMEVPKKDVAQEVAAMLNENLIQHNIHCMIDGETLRKCQTDEIIVESGSWLKKAGDLVRHRNWDYHHKQMRELCNSVINQCREFITDMVEREADYSNTLIQDMLKMIDQSMQRHKKLVLSEEMEITLKRHICSIAAAEFQGMHNNFLVTRDPQKMLKEWKKNYLEDFSDRFHNKDQGQKKAKEFVWLCLQPAVLDYVTMRTGPDVAQQLLISTGSKDVNAQRALNVLILEQLVSKLDYEKYCQYIHDYERFVKNWVLDHLEQKLSKEASLGKFEKKHLTDAADMITTAISEVRHSAHATGELNSFINCLCDALSKKLPLPANALDSIMILDLAYEEQFADHLTTYVSELQLRLAKQYEGSDNIRKRVRSVLFNTQQLNQLLGCKERCPFCKAPCEAGDGDHDQHFSVAHRPKGLSGLKASNTLVAETCFSVRGNTSTWSLSSNSQANENGSMHFLNWNFTVGPNAELSNYWKYVMVTFNEKIAKDFGVLPAKIPESWKSLTRSDVFSGLKGALK